MTVLIVMLVVSTKVVLVSSEEWGTLRVDDDGDLTDDGTWKNTDIFAIPSYHPDDLCRLVLLAPMGDSVPQEERQETEPNAREKQNGADGQSTPQVDGRMSYSYLAAAEMALDHLRAADFSVVSPLDSNDAKQEACSDIPFSSVELFHGYSTGVDHVHRPTSTLHDNHVPICALLGPFEDEAAVLWSIWGTVLNTPLVVMNSMAPSLTTRSSSSSSPLTLRNAVPLEDYAHVVMEYFQDRPFVSLLYDSSDATSAMMAPLLKGSAPRWGVRLETHAFRGNEEEYRRCNVETETDGTNDDDDFMASCRNGAAGSLEQALWSIKERGYHTIVVSVKEMARHLETLAQLAHNLELLGNDYLWIFTSSSLSLASSDCVDSPVVDLLLRGSGVIHLVDPFSVSAAHDPFATAWRKQNQTLVHRLNQRIRNDPAFVVPAPPDYFQTNPPSPWASFVYDVTWAVGSAACRVVSSSLGNHTHEKSRLRKEVRRAISQRLVPEILNATTFRGASGNVRFHNTTRGRLLSDVLFGMYNIQASPTMDSQNGKKRYKMVLTASRSELHGWHSLPPSSSRFIYRDGTTQEPQVLRTVVNGHFLPRPLRSFGVYGAAGTLLACALGTAAALLLLLVVYDRQRRLRPLRHDHSHRSRRRRRSSTSNSCQEPTTTMTTRTSRRSHQWNVRPVMAILGIPCLGAILGAMSIVSISMDESHVVSSTGSRLDTYCQIQPSLFFLGYLLNVLPIVFLASSPKGGGNHHHHHHHFAMSSSFPEYEYVSSGAGVPADPIAAGRLLQVQRQVLARTVVLSSASLLVALLLLATLLDPPRWARHVVVEFPLETRGQCTRRYPFSFFVSAWFLHWTVALSSFLVVLFMPTQEDNGGVRNPYNDLLDQSQVPVPHSDDKEDDEDSFWVFWAKAGEDAATRRARYRQWWLWGLGLQGQILLTQVPLVALTRSSTALFYLAQVSHRGSLFLTGLLSWVGAPLLIPLARRHGPLVAGGVFCGMRPRVATGSGSANLGTTPTTSSSSSCVPPLWLPRASSASALDSGTPRGRRRNTTTTATRTTTQKSILSTTSSMASSSSRLDPGVSTSARSAPMVLTTRPPPQQPPQEAMLRDPSQVAALLQQAYSRNLSEDKNVGAFPSMGLHKTDRPPLPRPRSEMQLSVDSSYSSSSCSASSSSKGGGNHWGDDNDDHHHHHDHDSDMDDHSSNDHDECDDLTSREEEEEAEDDEDLEEEEEEEEEEDPSDDDNVGYPLDAEEEEEEEGGFGSAPNVIASTAVLNTKDYRVKDEVCHSNSSNADEWQDDDHYSCDEEAPPQQVDYPHVQRKDDDDDDKSLSLEQGEMQGQERAMWTTKPKQQKEEEEEEEEEEEMKATKKKTKTKKKKKKDNGKKRKLSCEYLSPAASGDKNGGGGGENGVMAPRHVLSRPGSSSSLLSREEYSQALDLARAELRQLEEDLMKTVLQRRQLLVAATTAAAAAAATTMEDGVLSDHDDDDDDD